MTRRPYEVSIAKTPIALDPHMFWTRPCDHDLFSNLGWSVGDIDNGFEVSFDEIPATSVALPAAGDPRPLSGLYPLPVPGRPFVVIAVGPPYPVSFHPNLVIARRGGNNLHAFRRGFAPDIDDLCPWRRASRSHPCHARRAKEARRNECAPNVSLSDHD